MKGDTMPSTQNFTDREGNPSPLLAAPPASLPAYSGNGLGEDKASMERVREILFGNRMREFEIRVEEGLERLRHNFSQTQNDTQAQLASLEKHIRGELEALIEVQRQEQEETRRSLSQLSEEMNRSKRELRELVFEQVRQLQGRIRAEAETAQSQLERIHLETDRRKLDSHKLASLLSALAMDLDEAQFHSPH
jgi:chromosome segregation ATPase